MKSAMNPIAGTHWIWRMASCILVHWVLYLQASKEKWSVGSVFWNVAYKGRVDYKELVAKRMFNIC